MNALNRMLTVLFALRIDWYTNKGQINSTTNKRIDVSLRSAAQRDNIDSVHELIFNNQSAAQWDRLCYKTAAQRDRAGDSDILYIENIG